MTLTPHAKQILMSSLNIRRSLSSSCQACIWSFTRSKPAAAQSLHILRAAARSPTHRALYIALIPFYSRLIFDAVTLSFNASPYDSILQVVSQGGRG